MVKLIATKTGILPSSAKPSKAPASASAEISLIIDSTHPPTRESTETWNLSYMYILTISKTNSMEEDLNRRRP